MFNDFWTRCLKVERKITMESMRDINRVMEREVAKGSCPLAFERMEFGSKPFQFIISEEKLNEVLTYLLRIRTFGQYAGKSIINNVYMDLDMLCKKPQFKRTRSVVESNYIKGLCALAFQGFFIMVCVGIYSVLVSGVAVAGNLHSALWSVAAYTVILCFSLFKTGSLSKSIFNAH